MSSCLLWRLLELTSKQASMIQMLGSTHSPVEKEPLAVQAYMCWLSIFLLDILSVPVGYAEAVRPELVVRC